MKYFNLLHLLILILSPLSCLCQAVEALPAYREAMENQTLLYEREPEEDEDWQELTAFRGDPLDLNAAGAEELRIFPFLSSLQIAGFLRYRRLLGSLESIYELQAVPGFDLPTIRRLLPFVRVGNGRSFSDRFRPAELFRKGKTTVLTRYERTLEKAAGYHRKERSAAGASFYLGSPDKLLLRYRYLFSRRLSYGFTAEKDAGEEWFRGSRKKGFDFYSAHFFLQDQGHLKALAAGDFTVNMGQGLVNWQGLSFGKSSAAMNIQKTAPLLKPYTSAGEINFYRGAGATMTAKSWEATVFASSRPVDANLVFPDPATGEEVFSGIKTSGYHRTYSELADYNSMEQKTIGGNITFRRPAWHIGLNGIHHRFSGRMEKRDVLYNRFAFSGDHLTNASAGYAAGFRNLYFFGETAFSFPGSWATVDGLLMSVDPHVDLALLYRRFDKRYHVLHGSAFGESASPENESGFYTGLTLRLLPQLKVDGYADLYRFPWLKYRVNAPAGGYDYLLQAGWEAGKRWQALLRFREKGKPVNAATGAPVAPVIVSRKRQVRGQVNILLNKVCTLRTQGEWLLYREGKNGTRYGYLVYANLRVAWDSRFRGYLRLAWFHTDGFDTRIYAYENNVRYAYSIPFFYGKGMRWYINLHRRFGRRYTMEMRVARSVYFDRDHTGSGLDEIPGRHKTTLTLQVLWEFDKK